MPSIRIPSNCIERWNGSHFFNKPNMQPNGNVTISVMQSITEDVSLLSKTFLAWAGSSIPKAEIIAVYVSGEADSFEVRGSEEDIMLVRMRWYRDQPVPVAEELPEHLYVTAPYSYHAESAHIPSDYKLA